MAESFLATITTKSRASNGRGRWDMCIREASATSWIINTKVSTLILFVEQTPGVGAQRERAATRGANKKIKERAVVELLYYNNSTTGGGVYM